MFLLIVSAFFLHSGCNALRLGAAARWLLMLCALGWLFGCAWLMGALDL